MHRSEEKENSSIHWRRSNLIKTANGLPFPNTVEKKNHIKNVLERICANYVLICQTVFV